jgi:hypothetical protein
VQEWVLFFKGFDGDAFMLPNGSLDWFLHCNRGKATYVERGGEQAYPQPTLSEHSRLYGFLLEGSLSHLQRLCDRTFNTLSTGFEPTRLQYRPATNLVMLTFGDNPTLRSQDPSAADKGYVGEYEVMFWVLTMAGYSIGPLFWVDHLAWFNPYVFVNSSFAMAGGREIYGYPKQWGWIELPRSVSAIDRFVLEASVIPTFTPETGAQRRLVIEIEPKPGCEVRMGTPWRTHHDARQALIEKVFGRDFELVLPGLGLPLHLLQSLVSASVPQVFLKQFRSIESASRPCYQAITEASSQLVQFRGGGWLTGEFRAQIESYASHPIAEDLGFLGSAPEVKLGLWTEFDFTLGAGKEVVRTV